MGVGPDNIAANQVTEDATDEHIRGKVSPGCKA
jgi:hypothetical protein